MVSNSSDFDLKNFTVPSDLQHQTQRGEEPPKADRYGIDPTGDPHRWVSWVVKLTFKKLGELKHGNGFYVNVPNATYDVILTAGHNLVDAPRQYCTDITIVTAARNIPVSHDMIRVCQDYLDEPDELSAIYDYGVILVKRSGPKPSTASPPGFGFSLLLSVPPPPGEKDLLQGHSLSVSAYKPEDTPPKLPRRSEGTCIVSGRDQLQYKAKTEPGMSGGPVWLGFNGVETVVAIHNYGADTDDEGNKGSRLNLDVWRTICRWVNVGCTNMSLHYIAFPPFSLHLHIHWRPPATSGPKKTLNGLGRVRVGRPGRVDTRFDVLPVSAAPEDKSWEACYGFLLSTAATPSGAGGTAAAAAAPAAGVGTVDASPSVWLRWEPTKRNVSPTDRLDAQCEVKLLHAVARPGQPFSVQTRLNEKSWAEVRMDMSLLDEEDDLGPLKDDPQRFEDTTEISFVPTNATATSKKFEFK